MELTEGTVSLHLGNDGVDKGEEIVLTLAHQHTDFAVGQDPCQPDAPEGALKAAALS
jgi:hypothetical protein